ncbi:MAG TPA: transcription antitermination factor NusB [Gemmataceae bacterium]|nr:transcription antitermination factor NusB [Gemmataceae bacterium]
MTRRSRAREVALQLLFQRDHNPNVNRADIQRFVHDRLRHPELEEFCLRLYDGVVEHLADIDRRLAAAAENWRLPRMAAIDRNVLRLGAQELLYMPDTPVGVALDEAIELARRYGSADSPRFVNGVLDRLRQDREKEEEAKAPPRQHTGPHWLAAHQDREKEEEAKAPRSAPGASAPESEPEASAPGAAPEGRDPSTPL